MKSYKLVHELLTLVEKLEGDRNGQEISLQDFAGFLLTRFHDTVALKPNADVRFGDKEGFAQQIAYQLENNIGRLFVYMSRYAKFYIKKALEDTPLQSPEDFTCLSILLTHDNLLKSDLISRNMQEKTSGTEVIKRLLNAKLVTQYDDEKDKRSKRLSITTTGRELLYRVFKDMRNVGTVVNGTLTTTEKLILQHLLQKLEDFHHDHHINKTIQTKDDIRALAEQLK